LSKIADLASTGEFDALSDEWFELLEGEAPFEEMAEVLFILSNNGKKDLSAELLELTIAEKELDGEESFSAFLVAAAGHFHVSEPLRKALIEAIRDEHLMFQPLEHFLKLSGLRTVRTDVSSSWRKFLSLMKYRRNGYVYHATFGTGQITRMSRTHATIDFQNAMAHNMILDVALETTLPLDPDSLLVLSWRNPDEFSRLLNDSPSAFLAGILNEPLVNGGGLRRLDLRPFFSESEFTESDAWKILKKTASGSDGFADLGDRIVLLDQNIDILEQIRNILGEGKVAVSEKAKQVQSLLKSCCSSFPDCLSGLLPAVKAISSPETGSLFELCWILTDKGSLKEFDEILPEYLEVTAARAERALGEIHSLPCRKTYLNCFFSGNTERIEKIRLLSALRRSPWEHTASFLEETDPELLSECIGVYLSRPSETDRFLWALSFLASRNTASDDNPAANQMNLFLDNLIFSSADTQKKVIHLLLGPLKEQLSSYLTSIHTRMLTNYLDSFNTSATAQNEGLCLALGREISRRKSSAFTEHRKSHFWETEALFSSRKAIEQRKSDIKRLKQIEIPAAADAIGVAASHGDLSENAEYAAAIEKRDLLLDRLKRWSEELQRYRPYPAAEINSDTVSPGIRVELQCTDASETVQILDLVGPLDADPEKRRINYLAPMGRIILGKSLGDTVFLKAEDSVEWRIASLEMLDLIDQ